MLCDANCRAYCEAQAKTSEADENAIDIWAEELRVYEAWKRRADLCLDDERQGLTWNQEEYDELERLCAEASRTRFFDRYVCPMEEANRGAAAAKNIADAQRIIEALINNIIVSDQLDAEDEKYAVESAVEWAGVKLDECRYIRYGERIPVSIDGYIYQNIVEITIGDAPAALANISDEARLQAVRNVLLGDSSCVYKATKK